MEGGTGENGAIALH